MRIAITGATGLIGRRLTTQLLDRGDEVVALTRDPARAKGRIDARAELLTWAVPTREAAPRDALAGADAVVHLLGEPVDQRWSARVKEEIKLSRILSTRNLVTGLRQLADGERPRTLVSQSATGYYGPRDDTPLQEDAEPGHDFLAEVVQAWETEAREAEDLLRVVRTRTGVVLARDGGALTRMLPPFKAGVGGPVGSGRQYIPWIHLDDVTGGIIHALDTPALTGAANLTAPDPVTNREFSKELGKVLHRPAVMRAPAVALKLAYGQMSTIVLTGQRVIPRVLLDSGYAFRFAELPRALADDGDRLVPAGSAAHR
jgi:uncharacterized protein (TIGR01777 family)